MEIFKTTNVCSLSALSHLRGTRVVAPFAATAQGTGVSIAMREKTATPATATALLPISDVVVYDGLAGIRSWSPPV